MLGSLARAPGRWGHIRPVRWWLAARRPPLRRADLAAAALGLLSTTFRLLSYDPYADGAWSRHASAVAAGLALALALWLFLRRLEPRSPWPAVAALFVLWCGDAVHLLRWAHPLARAGQLVVLREDFTAPALDPQRWLVATAGDGEALAGGGRLSLHRGPEGAAAADLRLRHLERFAAWPWLQLPPALLPVEHTGWLEQRLSWETTTVLSGSYLTVLELVERRVLVQVVPWGLYLTAPDPAGSIVEQSRPLPDAAQGGTHAWRLVQSPARLAIEVDGTVLWEAPPDPAPTFVRFGDSRRAPDHGGSLALSQLELRWQRPDGGE